MIGERDPFEIGCRSVEASEFANILGVVDRGIVVAVVANLHRHRELDAALRHKAFGKGTLLFRVGVQAKEPEHPMPQRLPGRRPHLEKGIEGGLGARCRRHGKHGTAPEPKVGMTEFSR